MNHGFSRFALRYLLTLGLGLGLVALHGAGGALTVLVPGCASPWELSKLLYWPLLGALVLERVLNGAEAGSVRCLPALALTPAVLLAAVWILTPPELLSGGVFALVWLVCCGAGLALAPHWKLTDRQRGILRVLAAAWGLAYILFALFPPAWGPFLDPASAAAMATIPC